MSAFMGLVSRLKFIKRWSLMRCVDRENVAEHSWEVATIAHMLAVIGKSQGKDINPESVATAALYHDASEVITSDFPTPVKYLNEDIRKTFAALEYHAESALLDSIPKQWQDAFRPLVVTKQTDPQVKRYIKAADVISAYLTASREVRNGNSDFIQAEDELLERLTGLNMDEVEAFRSSFFGGYQETLDSLLKRPRSV
jgi:5'-deoxynucleotidase